jgi:hypothetical protein
MNELKIQTQKIREKALSLRDRVNDSYLKKGIKINKRGISGLLEIVAEDMNEERIDKKRLESHAFGIFRIITDGWIFEDTDLGKDLMEFRLGLRKFASNIPEVSEPGK